MWLLKPYLEVLWEAAPDAMVVVDQRGVMLFVNRQTERLFGYLRKELVGQKVEMLVPARYSGRHSAHRDGFFANPHVRGMGTGLELYALRADGSEFPVEISLSPLDIGGSTVITSAIRDVTERRRFREKELLLKEIHHRIKNNLQVVSSMLKLHAERIEHPEARAAFDDAQQRVRAIALLHESLHDLRDSGPVDLDSYARALISSLLRVAGTDVSCSIQVINVRLSLDQAMPCGLILNELVSNALEHAFSTPVAERADEPKKITVRAALVDNEVSIEVADNGIGFADGSLKGSLGLHLIRTLVRQLDGRISFDNRRGTVARVVFPSDLRNDV